MQARKCPGQLRGIPEPTQSTSWTIVPKKDLSVTYDCHQCDKSQFRTVILAVKAGLLFSGSIGGTCANPGRIPSLFLSSPPYLH